MEYLEVYILGLLNNSPRPMKAREIVKLVHQSYGLSVTRKDVNCCLYGVIRGFVINDPIANTWSIRTHSDTNTTPSSTLSTSTADSIGVSEEPCDETTASSRDASPTDGQVNVGGFTKKTQRFCQCGRVAISKEKYCKDCKKAVLTQLQEDGYLDPRPIGQPVQYRTSEQKENTRETRMGVDG